LVGLIAAAIARGELSDVDPEHAAEELFGMWQGFTSFQISLGIDIDVIRNGLPERVERAVALFLHFYGKPNAPRGRSSSGL